MCAKLWLFLQGESYSWQDLAIFCPFDLYWRSVSWKGATFELVTNHVLTSAMQDELVLF